MAENEQVETQTIEIPQPLSLETFRQCLIEEVKNNSDLEPGEELSDEEAYKLGIGSIFDSVSHACVNSDYEELYTTLQYFGFYSDEELQELSMMEATGQFELVHNVLRGRIANIDDIEPVFNFYDTYNRFEEAKDISQIQQSVKKLDDTFFPMLEEDVKAQIYFNAATRYQGFNTSGIPQVQEVYALLKTLRYTTDPGIIEMCKQRLDVDEKDLSSSENRYRLSKVKTSYKNAIEKTEDADVLYELHSNLANICLNEASVPGFTCPGTSKEKSLQDAIYHYQAAVELANKQDGKKEALENLAKAQRQSGNDEDWAMTKCQIAKLISIPRDKYKYLLRVAEDLGNSHGELAKELAKTTLEKIKKDEKLDPISQKDLQIRAYTYLSRSEQDPTEKAGINNNITLLQKQMDLLQKKKFHNIID